MRSSGVSASPSVPVEWMVPTWYADEAASPRSTSSRSMPRCAAISSTEGDLPDLWTSSSVARRTSRCRSFAERGTRTVQLWSRKCRLSSPSIVLPANAANGTP